MTTKSVAIRIGTEGKAQVKSDFADVRQAGAAAFKGIGDSAREMTAASEAQLNRLVAANDRALADMEAADRRRAATADKLNAMAPKTAMQARIEGATGSGYGTYAGSAKQSADAIRELLALEEEQAAKAAAIQAVLNPLAGAQARYNSELAETRALQAAGKISAGELAQYETLLKDRLDAVTMAHQRSNASAGQFRAGMQQLSYQLGDASTMFALGAKPQQIFASQLDQTIGAVQLMAGEGTKLAAFLSNPWVQAATLATVVLGPLVANLLATSDASEKALDKLKKDAKQTEETRQAKIEFAKTEQGVTAAIYDQQEALGKNIDKLKSEEQRNYEAAKANLAFEIQTRNTTKALLEQLIAQEELTKAYMRSPNAAKEGVTGSSLLQNDIDAIQRAKDNLAKEDAAIAAARNTVIGNQSLFSVAEGKRLGDPLEVIKDKYEGPNGLIEQARKRAVAEGKVGDALQRQVMLIKQQEEQELASARKAGSGSSASAQASIGDMTALIEKLFPGAHITSTTGGKHVSGSDHYAGRAIDFVPSGGMGQYSKAEVEKILEDAGVTIRRNAGGTKQFFGPGDKGHSDHFHVAWTGSASPEEAQRRGEQAAREAERAREEAIRRQRDFDQASSDLDAKLLVIRRGGLTDVDQIAAFEKQQVDVEAEKYRLAVEAKVKLGDYTRAQADELEAKNKLLATLQSEDITRKAQADKLRAMGSLQDEMAGHQIELLQEHDRLAKTAAERRVIELQILDLQKEEARRRYEQVIELGKLGQATAEQVTAAQDGLKNLDSVYGARGEGVKRQTAGPLESYSREMDQTKQQIYERVQGYAVDELEYFRKGLDDAITDKLGVKDPFLKQLIDMFIEQWLIKPITDALANAASSSGGGGSILGSIGTAISGGIGALLGGGGGLGSADIAGAGSYDFSSFGNISVGGNAVGTERFSGGYTWLAENGPELVNLPAGSKVTPAAQTRRLLAGSNDNRPMVYQNFDFTGALTTDDVLRQAEERSRATAQQVTEAGITGLIDRNRRSYGRLLSPGN